MLIYDQKISTLVGRRNQLLSIFTFVAPILFSLESRDFLQGSLFEIALIFDAIGGLAVYLIYTQKRKKLIFRPVKYPKSFS
jgi:hypothetical protein